MEKVSVIVPVYNVEKYINRCIESIVNQTYRNLEIILINDGSTDGSETICKMWEKKDERIKVYSKNNEGLGPTRNFGILISQGKYLAFIDSDDWWENNAIEELVSMAEENDADMVYMNFYWEYEQENGNYLRREYCQQCLFEGVGDSNMYPDLIFSKDARTWSKFYKKTLFVEKNIVFPNHPFEDFPINPLLVLSAKRICQVHKPLYHYHMNRMGNITGRTDSYKYISQGLHELEKSLEKRGYLKSVERELAEYSIQLSRDIINGGVEPFVFDQLMYYLNHKYPMEMQIYTKRIYYIGSFSGLLLAARNLLHNQIVGGIVTDIPDGGDKEIKNLGTITEDKTNCDYVMMDFLDVKKSVEQIENIKVLLNSADLVKKTIIIPDLHLAYQYGTDESNLFMHNNCEEVYEMNKIIERLTRYIYQEFEGRVIRVKLEGLNNYTYINTVYGCDSKYYNGKYYKNAFREIKNILGENENE